jgi:predicted nuclease of restriction endonuclease-like (RecB) superfamily
MSEYVSTNNYQSLKHEIGELLSKGRAQAGRAINTILVQTYWHIRRHIVEFEQSGKEKAEYGAELLNRLSKDLTLEFGKGFSRSNLFQIRQFYLKFPKIKTLSGQLSWSHYAEIIKAENDLEISFYAKESEKEKWSVRELKRQMKGMLFHRLALCKDKQGVLQLAEKGTEIINPADVKPIAEMVLLLRLCRPMCGKALPLPLSSNIKKEAAPRLSANVSFKR